MRQISLQEMLRSLHAALYQLKMSSWEREQIHMSFAASGEAKDTSVLTDKQVEFIEMQYNKHK
jgi:hypothetical protein